MVGHGEALSRAVHVDSERNEFGPAGVKTCGKLGGNF
jgi:hypothetical protein